MASQCVHMGGRESRRTREETALRASIVRTHLNCADHDVVLLCSFQTVVQLHELLELILRGNDVIEREEADYRLHAVAL